jgi:rhodanese-related sulfurtransferase
MRRIALALLAAAALTGTLTSCSSDTGQPAAAATTQPERVGVSEFAAVITAPGTVIIDVRTPQEFAEGHIEGAVNIPVESPDFRDNVAQLDPNVTYAVYCRSGNRSQGAVEEMASVGLTDIYELESGTVGWSDAGQPLVQ